MHSTHKVSMEVVSPKLRSDGDWEKEIELFWEAMRKVFKIQTDTHCGSHIHVAPIGTRFSLEDLKRISFAICLYENPISVLLPTERRNNTYCKLNSQSAQGLRQALQRRTETTLRQVANEIKAITRISEFCSYMQADRYVLWNFANTAGSGSGTVEFRGGRHLRGRFRTKRWITFTVVFVLMAMEEVSFFLSWRCIKVVRANL